MIPVRLGRLVSAGARWGSVVRQMGPSLGPLVPCPWGRACQVCCSRQPDGTGLPQQKSSRGNGRRREAWVSPSGVGPRARRACDNHPSREQPSLFLCCPCTGQLSSGGMSACGQGLSLPLHPGSDRPPSPDACVDRPTVLNRAPVSERAPPAPPKPTPLRRLAGTCRPCTPALRRPGRRSALRPALRVNGLPFTVNGKPLAVVVPRLDEGPAVRAGLKARSALRP